MSEEIAGSSNSDHSTEESEDEMIVYKKNALKVITFQISKSIFQTSAL